MVQRPWSCSTRCAEPCTSGYISDGKPTLTLESMDSKRVSCICFNVVYKHTVLAKALGARVCRVSGLGLKVEV